MGDSDGTLKVRQFCGRTITINGVNYGIHCTGLLLLKYAKHFALPARMLPGGRRTQQ